MNQLSKLSCMTAGAALLCLPLTATWAQEEDEDYVMHIEEVTVTARKREETLQEIPVAISVFNQDAIVAADMKSLDDVANFTPGFQFVNQGNQQPGRYNTQLQFRGLTTAQFSPSFATGALFIDGIYVLNGGTSLALMDLERVEVIKGPQAAYFGRNTFGGAVNMITRDPNMQEFSGSASLRTTTRSNNDVNAFIEGPIISEKLSFSLSGRYYDKKGHYTASDEFRMGNEETTTINGVLLWEPTENLYFKVRYAWSEDDDGPPAQAFISGILNDSCTGTTIDTPEGPAHPTRYICGRVPDLNSAIVDPGARVISSNSFLPDFVRDLGLADPATTIPGVPNVNDVGLKRETERLSFFASWDINDYSIDFTYGKNEQRTNSIRDFDISDRVNWFSRDPQYMDDDSYEIRLTSPQDGRFRWLIGANKYTQEFTASGAGGDATTSCFSTVGPLTDDFPAACLGGTVGILNLLFPNNLNNTDEADVQGIFGAVDFDFNDQWTVSLEGRWQEDKITKGGGLVNEGQPILSETYDDFLPRAILRWQPGDMTNLYLSYSEGMIAGDFNTFFINADEREREQYLAQDPNISETLDQESLKAWEIGWKQGFDEGRGQVNLAFYYYKWKNIKGRSSFQINETCRESDMGATGCNPDLGIMVGDPKQIPDPATGSLIPFYNSRNILLPGDATIKGIELETWWAPNQDWMLTLNFSYIDSKYDDYEFNFVAPIAGYAQMAGNQTPRQPKYSGNTSATYFYDIADLPSYVRADLIYQGKSFVDESNLAYISAYTLFNLRAGIDTDRWLVELFAQNLFNEDAWLTGSRWTDFSSPTQFAYLTFKQGVALSPQDKREYGIRAVFRW